MPTYQQFNIRENKENNNYKRQVVLFFLFFSLFCLLHGLARSLEPQSFKCVYIYNTIHIFAERTFTAQSYEV